MIICNKDPYLSAFCEPVNALSLRTVSRRFGRRQAVDGVSLDVRRGEVLCLVGPSGCGKSTTLRIAAGLERPDSGAVLVGGHLVEGEGRHVPPENRGVGLMFQDYALFPHLSVLANVAFGLFGLPRSEREALAKDELQRVGLSHLMNNYPHTLSGGEQQRVALARMLAPQPAVVLMDEPFSGLDARTRDEIRRRTLMRLREENAAVVIVTHDPEEAVRIGDRVALMRDGRIVQEGTPVDVYRAPRDPQAATLFGGANIFHTRVANGRANSPFGYAGANGISEDAWAEVIFRPSAIRVGDAGVPARVIAVRPHGAHCEIEVNIEASGVPSGVEAPAFVRAAAPADKAVAQGACVYLSADPADAFVFPCQDKACRG
ncbi:MAG: ABC transporter ATP-binding protein [Alphaproteobacteria bacterium]